MCCKYFIFSAICMLIYECDSQLKVFSPADEQHAEPLLRYGFQITNMTNLRLSIKACGNAHLIIQKGSVPMLYPKGNYAFIIGSYGNTKVQLANSMHDVPRLASEAFIPLDCDEARPFWISWKDGDLKIGKGTVLFADEIVASSVGSLNGYKYAFIVTGWGSDGCWTIDIANQIVAQNWRNSYSNMKIQGDEVVSYTTKSKLKCMLKCAHAKNLSCACRQFSYNDSTKECLVIGFDNVVTLVVDGTWKTWDLL